MKCKYNIDEICVNANCPYRADYCPCYEEDDICKFKDDFLDQQNAQIEHLTAEKTRLENMLKDFMKDEVTT